MVFKVDGCVSGDICNVRVFLEFYIFSYCVWYVGGVEVSVNICFRLGMLIIVKIYEGFFIFYSSLLVKDNVIKV